MINADIKTQAKFLKRLYASDKIWLHTKFEAFRLNQTTNPFDHRIFSQVAQEVVSHRPPSQAVRLPQSLGSSDLLSITM